MLGQNSTWPFVSINLDDGPKQVLNTSWPDKSQFKQTSVKYRGIQRKTQLTAKPFWLRAHKCIFTHWKGVSEHCWKTHLKTMSLASCWVSSFYSNCHREGHDGKKKRDNFRFSFMTPGKLRIATLISRVGLRRNTAVSNLCMWLVAWSLPARAKEETSSLLTHPVVCIPIHAPLSRKHLFLVLRDLS